MRKPFMTRVAAAVIATFSICSPLLAADLRGTWDGAYVAHIYHPDETDSGDVRMTLVIENMSAEDGFIEGYHEWFLDEDHDGMPDNGTEVVREAREDVVGIIGFDGHSIKLIETHDNGTFEGYLAADGTLKLIYAEAGHNEATIFRVSLTRRPNP